MPRVFRISQCVQSFNPNLQRQTNVQAWIRLFDLPMEYWDPSLLMDIPGGVVEPLRMDNKTLRKELGTFSRVFVDIDIIKNFNRRNFNTKTKV